MVWDFKGKKGNSHGDGRAMFGKRVFAGPSLTLGHREDFDQALRGSHPHTQFLLNCPHL